MESWAIAGDRSVDVHHSINARFDIKGILNDRESLFDEIPSISSIKEANERRLSLAVVKPDVKPNFYLEFNQNRVVGKKSTKAYDYTPRLKFIAGGNTHKLKYLNQEVYENLGKNMHNMGLLKIKEKFQTNPRLLIGNMFAFRNNWLVIAGLTT
jgi:hypothetical protein